MAGCVRDPPLKALRSGVLVTIISHTHTQFTVFHHAGRSFVGNRGNKTMKLLLNLQFKHNNIPKCRGVGVAGFKVQKSQFKNSNGFSVYCQPYYDSKLHKHTNLRKQKIKCKRDARNAQIVCSYLDLNFQVKDLRFVD